MFSPKKAKLGLTFFTQSFPQLWHEERLLVALSFVLREQETDKEPHLDVVQNSGNNFMLGHWSL